MVLPTRSLYFKQKYSSFNKITKAKQFLDILIIMRKPYGTDVKLKKSFITIQ